MLDPHVQLISVLGAECTGKSTLCPALATAENGRWLAEYVREFCALHDRPPRQDEQAHVAAEQIRREQVAARESGRVFVDSSPLMTAIYSIHYFDDRSLLEPALAHQRSYAATLVCDTDLPWIADGLQRDSATVRMRCQGLLLEALQRARIDYTRSDIIDSALGVPQNPRCAFRSRFEAFQASARCGPDGPDG
jgi:nicotinamide riboside kinase